MKAKDIMETNVITIPPDMPVHEIAQTLSKNNMTALPVVDAEENIVGIVSESDLIYRLAHPHIPPHIELLGGIIYLENPFEMKQEFKKLMAITAKDLMTEKVLTVTEDADVEDIATLMVEKEINGVPVVKGGKIVGIVTRHDLIKALIKTDSYNNEVKDEEGEDANENNNFEESGEELQSDKSVDSPPSEAIGER